MNSVSSLQELVIRIESAYKRVVKKLSDEGGVTLRNYERTILTSFWTPGTNAVFYVDLQKVEKYKKNRS